jgi:hypothetical protein
VSTTQYRLGCDHRCCECTTKCNVCTRHFATVERACRAEYGRGTLPQDALVCLASPGEKLVFALVVRREAKEVSAH